MIEIMEKDARDLNESPAPIFNKHTSGQTPPVRMLGTVFVVRLYLFVLSRVSQMHASLCARSTTSVIVSIFSFTLYRVYILDFNTQHSS